MSTPYDAAFYESDFLLSDDSLYSASDFTASEAVADNITSISISCGILIALIFWLFMFRGLK